MPQILSFVKKMRHITNVGDRRIDSHLRSSMREYRAILHFAIERALGKVVGGKYVDPVSYYNLEDSVLKNIKSDMEGWWNGLIPEAEQIGKNAYFDVYDAVLKSFNELFDVELVKVSDNDIPDVAGPDSAKDIDLNTDGFISRKEGGTANLPGLRLVIGEGGANAGYENFIRQQFNDRLDPRNHIKTFSAKDIARIENELIVGLRQGVDTTVVRKRLIDKLVANSATKDARRRIAYNIRRILRTTHQNASITSAFQMAMINPAVVGVVRHTGPRPCIACIVLSGKVYKNKQSFRDHPNGQCFVTFEIAQPEQLGINIAALSVGTRRLWRTHFGNIPNRRYSFLASSDAEKRKVFANNALFDLWKEEKLPLEATAVYKDGTFRQASYKELLSNLHNLGGISYPKIKFPTQGIASAYNGIIDPKDRANAALAFIASKPKGDIRNKFGEPKYPDRLTQGMVDNANLNIRAMIDRIMAGYVGVSTMPWYAYNDLARALDLGIRRTIVGGFYYVK